MSSFSLPLVIVRHAFLCWIWRLGGAEKLQETREWRWC
ncbi:hypothetical protein GLYMA_10G116951v4 [Glycine max]|nr:hypothetical protein GLYMA_10G116951v4 [Glycine max]KAH1137801.1 hypothetical protein GYH30_027698 [Glycine max]